METIAELTARYPGLAACEEEIVRAASIIIEAYRSGGFLYTCGNGGSAADADHIVGELMKGFIKKRPLPSKMKEKILAEYPNNGAFMSDNLQCGLPAVSLHSQSAFLTAFFNDVEPSLIYAQALFSMAKAGDILIAISTSGNSENVVNAAKIAKTIGVKVIALTGDKQCALDLLSDVCIHVGERETYRVQELHLPVYHWLCARIEEEFFSE